MEVNLVNNPILLVALLACFVAQALKFVVELIKNRRLNLRSLVSTGGMPSAHSALVGALATGIGQNLGFNSPEFAIAALFAVIVMYDAAGVRQAAGKQARILNQIIDELFEEHEFNEEKLKELVGHNYIQVFVGLALGISISLVVGRAF